MPKKLTHKGRPFIIHEGETNEITDLREHARDRRTKQVGDQIVTILRDMLTSWKVPKPGKE